MRVMLLLMLLLLLLLLLVVIVVLPFSEIALSVIAAEGIEELAVIL